MGRRERAAVGRILFPARFSAADVAAELAVRILGAGLIARQQVLAIARVDDKDRKCWMDLVVFRTDQTPVCIVELKNETHHFRNGKSNKQINKYLTFGLPVLVCRGMPDVEKTMAEVAIITKTKEQV